MAYPDFYNCNENRAYPFVQQTNGKLIFDAAFSLPDNVILDAGFTLGIDSGFDNETSYVDLSEFSWSYESITFVFSVDSIGVSFVFVRSREDLRGATEYVEAEEGASAGVGFLVTGEVSALIDNLTALYGTTGTLSANYVENIPKLEPSTITYIGGQRVETVNVANIERYTVDGCCNSISEYAEVGHTVASGLVGNIKLKAGYNTRINVNPLTNVVTFFPEQAAGLGEPCEEVERWPTETKPSGSSLFSGGDACGDLIYTVNGVSPTENGVFRLNGGSGISVVAYPDQHRIDIINTIESTLHCSGE